MSIALKTNLLIIFMAVLLSLSAYFIQRSLVYPAFIEIELDYARDNIDRVARRLEDVLNTIDFIVYDWSSWDDTYRFLDNRNEAYLESNLKPETFLNYDFQVALLLDRGGDATWAGVYDFQAEENDIDQTDQHLNTLLPIANKFSERIDLNANVDDQKTRGIFQIEGQPVLFSMRPVYRSDGTGDPRGYVLFGQALSDRRIEELSEQIVLDFTIEPIIRDNGPPPAGAYSIEVVDEQQLSASKVMMIDGIPSLRASVTLPRQITRLGSEITAYGIALFVLMSLSMSITLLLLFRLLVIKPILELKSDISKISDAMDYSLRTHIRNEDEIGSLSREFNAMLSVIESNNKELKKLSETDPLTGLLNRLALDKELSRAWSILTRTGDPIAVMLIDIDYFKPYNDHYGHLAGDECLRQIAQILKGVAKRDADLVARFGGEEFLIVLPGTDAGAALDIARGVLKAVTDAEIEHISSDTAAFITVSIGVSAVVPTSNQTSSDLIKAADKALYKAKESGRDAVKFEALPQSEN